MNVSNVNQTRPSAAHTHVLAISHASIQSSPASVKNRKNSIHSASTLQPTLHCPADIFLKPKNIKSMTTDKVIKMMSADKLTLYSASSIQGAELTNPSQAKAAVLNNRSNKAAINNDTESETNKTKSVNAKTSNYPIRLKTATSSHSNTDAATNLSTPTSSNDSPLITNNSVFTDSASNSESKSLFNVDLTNIDFTAISFFISGILLMIYFFHLA